MLGGIVAAFVHAEHERHVLALSRRRDQDFLRSPAVDVRARFLGVGEESGGLDDHVHAERLPRQLGGVAFGQNLDLATVHGQRVAAGRNVALVGTVVAVVLEHVRALRRARQIVDRGDADVRMALGERLCEVSSYAAEAVNPDEHAEVLPGALALPLP